MTDKSAEDIRYEEVLNSPGAELKNFFTQTPSNLFPNAVTYPDFLNHNLLSPNRVIKHLGNDPHSNLRVFYFNMFRLSYYLITDNGLNNAVLMNLRNYVLHPHFQILFTSDTEPNQDLYNDQQFKKLFVEFLYLLDEQESPDIESIFNCFPIIDTVMIHLLRSVLAKEGHDYDFSAKIPTEQLFVDLCNTFGLSLTAYDSCWKFQDSDLFCLENANEEIYMAYIESADSDAELPVEETKSYGTGSISLDIASSPNDIRINISGVYQLPNNYAPFPTSSYSMSQQFQMVPSAPLITTSGSQQFVQNSSSSNYSSPYGISSKSLPTQSAFSKSNGITADHSPMMSDYEQYSRNSPEMKLYQPFSLSPNTDLSTLQSPGSSAISLVSETYEFVDFTNTQTFYKDKVPRNKFSTNPKPITHIYDKFQTKHSEFPQYAKADRSSPIYESSQKYKTDQIRFDFSKYDASYQPFQQSQYQLPKFNEYENRAYKSGQFAQSQSSTNHYESYHSKPDIPKIDIVRKEVDYQPAYKPLYSIPEVMSSVQSTDSYINASDSTPIYKLSQKQIYSETRSNLESDRSQTLVFPPQMTVSITASTNQKDLGDYYRDFTNSFLLEKLDQPFKSNVRAIKNRVRGLKRKGVTPNTFEVNSPPTAKPNFARALYEEQFP